MILLLSNINKYKEEMINYFEHPVKKVEKTLKSKDEQFEDCSNWSRICRINNF